MTKKPGAIAAILPDLSPLRSSRDFRLLWVQGLVTTVGSFMAMIALPLQIKDLTGSPLAVGAMGLVELVPLIVFGLYGGALADAVDRRKVILLTEAGLGLLAAVLLMNALLPEPMLWPLYVVAAWGVRAGRAPASGAGLADGQDRAARPAHRRRGAQRRALAGRLDRGAVAGGCGRRVRGSRDGVRTHDPDVRRLRTALYAAVGGARRT